MSHRPWGGGEVPCDVDTHPRVIPGALWLPKCSQPRRASLTFRGCSLIGIPGYGLPPAEAASLRGPVPSAPWPTAGGQRWALARRAGLKRE